MTSDDSLLSLSDAFADADLTAWRSMVEQALKGRPFEDTLVSRLREGITVQPIYTLADQPWDDDTPSDLASLVSGHQTGNRVLIRQICDNQKPETAGCDIERDLKGGVDCLVLVWADPAQTSDPRRAGLNINDLHDLECLLNGVDLAATPLALEAGARFLPASGLLLAYYQHRAGSLDGACLEVNADPLAVLARDGIVPCGLAQALRDMTDLAVMFDGHGSGLVAVGVDSGLYSDAGADAVQELACLIATGLTYIKALTQEGLTLESANRQIAFTLSSDTDIFLNIAKFRAARLLWARIISAAGGDTALTPMTLNARTAARMLTRRDPWVNMLRSTAAAFAAGIGGANGITVHGFDSALGVSGDLGRRIARNIPIILSEESGIGRVADPAAGCWYLETLTHQLAQAAWSQFQWIESCGGMVAALHQGELLSRIDQSYQKYQSDIAHRLEPITGVSAFPDIHEKPIHEMDFDRSFAASSSPDQSGVSPPCPEPDAAMIDQALATLAEDRLCSIMAAARAGASMERLTAELSRTGQPDQMKPWPRHRLAAEFEALRDRSDFLLDAEGWRPRVFLANLGPVASHTARATFARNFFEAGGFDVLTNDGFATSSDVEEAFRKVKIPRSEQEDPALQERATQFSPRGNLKIACLCGHDDAYAEQAADVAGALKQAGAQVVCLAGKPGDHQYGDAAIDLYIHEGCAMLATLNGLYERFGWNST